MAAPTFRLFLMLAALPVAGCGDRQPDPSSRGASARDDARSPTALAARQNEAEAEREIATDARIDALTNQVDRLEQSVADVQSGASNSSTMDARITALEQKVYASDPTHSAGLVDDGRVPSASPAQPVKPGPVLAKPAPVRRRVAPEQ